ncbi:MAG: zinc ribbon domain-containing protein [Planctomycetes bacterium]|nr:zinc ribbon domain-containing protein [Planctomycetota bacterium]
MPTYEYRCSKCGWEFEEFQSITAKPLRKCPRSGRLAVNRLISAGAGVIFRGSGFYETDYRSESYQKAAKKDKPAAASKPDTPGNASPTQAAPAVSTASTKKNIDPVRQEKSSP